MAASAAARTQASLTALTTLPTPTYATSAPTRGPPVSAHLGSPTARRQAERLPEGRRSALPWPRCDRSTFALAVRVRSVLDGKHFYDMGQFVHSVLGSGGGRCCPPGRRSAGSRARSGGRPDGCAAPRAAKRVATRRHRHGTDRIPRSLSAAA